MQQGRIDFTAMERVAFGRPTADALVEEADRLDAKRVFILASRTLNRETDAIRKVESALGGRFAGVFDHMPAHSPRDAVVACAAAARAAGCDLLATIGGGSATDGGKAVTICLKHDITHVDEMEAFRTKVDSEGQRHFPEYEGPDTPIVCVPTTLSGGEFNARAGVTDTRIKLKQSFIHRNLIPTTVILDPEITRHTPEWLFLSTGVRALDHAVETFLSLDANDYLDGPMLQALRLLGEGLPRVKANPDDLEARLKCLIGAWHSMTGVIVGARLGASHAIGHILGGSADVPHGHTSCVMLPYVLAWNASVNGERQKQIATAMGAPGQDCAGVIDRFISSLDMPRSLREVGVSQNQLPQLAENCLLDDWTFSNPRPIRTAEQVLEILNTAY